MKVVTLFACLLLSVSLAGQNAETDSLRRKLAAASEDDSNYVVLLEGLSYAYLSSYPDSALLYALKGLQLADKNDDPRGRYLCTEALANVYFQVGDYPKALELYLQVLKMKESLPYASKAVTYFNIADVYTEEADYQHALHYLFKAKEADEKARDSSGILFDLYSLSSIYLRMQKSDSALHYCQQSLNLAQAMHDENLIAAILNTFGEAYLSLKDTALARSYYFRSIPYAEAINDNQVLSANYFGLAKVFQLRNMPDSTMFYARKALQIAQDAPFLKQVMEISTFLSGVFKEIGGTDSAFKYLELSIATKDSLFNAENSRKVQGLKFQELQRQQAIETARIKFQNRIKLYGVIFLSLIFLVAALLQWRNNRQKQKAYALLQSQKEKTDQALKVLKETQNQLIQQEKMASLGELTAGIAHEIQNPLNFVNNFTELNRELIAELKLEIDRGNYPEARSIADDIDINEEKIVTHGKRADAIVKSMLQHSRTGNWQKELTNVNALCDEYFRLAYHGMRSRDNSFNVELKSDFDPSVGWRNIVPQDIGRVLLNLLNNAFYAVRQKAKSAGEPYKPEVQVCTRMTANLANAGPSEGTETLVIEVRDNGTGMPAKAMEKIFQPFFTTKPTGEGTGLGLSLCYDIVKAHGGEIKVESREREGTLFIVALPV